MCATGFVCWMRPFLHIFWFSFPCRKVSAVTRAICLISCHTCLLSFQRSVRQTERGVRECWKRRETMGGGGGDRSWLAVACVLWIAFECKGNAAFLTVWQNAMHGTTDGWMDRWVDGCRLWQLTACWLLCYSKSPTLWFNYICLLRVFAWRELLRRATEKNVKFLLKLLHFTWWIRFRLKVHTQTTCKETQSW